MGSFLILNNHKQTFIETNAGNKYTNTLYSRSALEYVAKVLLCDTIQLASLRTDVSNNGTKPLPGGIVVIQKQYLVQLHTSPRKVNTYYPTY